MKDCLADLEFRGLVYQMSDPQLGQRLDSERLTVYAGFDPTADSLHVGHLLGIFLLRRLQEAGHRPIVLAGGGTALIGDPGGKTEERALLDSERVQANLVGVKPQLERFLEFGSGEAGAVLVDNREWLTTAGLVEFLREVGKHFTVNQMISKESIRSRLAGREQGISFTEFSYMLLQAYDFLRLFDDYGCRLQAGGTDQWGNITMGIDLVRRKRGCEAWGMTWPLVLRPDGSKLGKTDAGTIWLDPRRTSPYQLFQYFLRTEDSLVGSYLRLFTWLAPERIEELERETLRRPEHRVAQRELARAVTTIVHGASEAARAERSSEALFGGDLSSLDEETLLEVFAEAPSVFVSRSSLAGGGLGLVEAMVTAGLAESNAAARRTIVQGGAYVNGRRETDPKRRLTPRDLLSGGYVVVRKGRREQHLLRFR